MDCQAQRARQDLVQGFSHESSTRCAREERVGPRSASTRTRRGASAQKTGQRAPVWDRKRAAAAGFLGQERRADQARGAGAASRWQRRGTRSSGRAAAGSVDFASFTLSQSPPFFQSGFPRIHNSSGCSQSTFKHAKWGHRLTVAQGTGDRTGPERPARGHSPGIRAPCCAAQGFVARPDKQPPCRVLPWLRQEKTRGEQGPRPMARQGAVPVCGSTGARAWRSGCRCRCWSTHCPCLRRAQLCSHNMHHVFGTGCSTNPAG